MNVIINDGTYTQSTINEDFGEAFGLSTPFEEVETTEEYTKDTTRRTRRINRRKKINQRKKMIESINKNSNIEEPAYLANHSEVAKYTTMGKSKKTKVRKAHSAYRSKLGGYGAAKKYSVKDSNSIEYINSQIKELDMEG